MSDCLEPDRILALLGGRFDEAERQACDRHLDRCGDCRALMAELVRQTPPAASPTPVTVALAPGGDTRPLDTPIDHGPSPFELERGLTVGRYLVLGRIGRGGMGTVYSAYDPQLDRKVAIKVLHTAGPSGHPQAARLRLLREAQAMAQVTHPNVITIHDVGSLDDQVFLAMELVDGQTLAGWLRSGTRDWRQIVTLFLRAGRGLAAAHTAGLVHRDFKPDNVLVGDDGRVRVTDFGLARAVLESEPLASGEGTPAEGASLLDTPLTQTGTVMGTPRYMAPEQHRGQTSDPRTDQFSFCVALYEALFGQPPFEGSKLEELARATAAGAVRPIARQSPVPQELRRALLRGLSARSEDRFLTMEALLEVLEQDPRRRLRRGLAVAGGALALAAAVGGTLLLQRGQREVCGGAPARAAAVWNEGRRVALERAFLGTGRVFAAATARKVSRLLDGHAAAWVRAHDDACHATHRRRVQSAEALELRMECLDRRLRSLGEAARLFAEADAASVTRAAQTARLLGDGEDCSDVAALRQPVAPPSRPAVRSEIAGLRTRLSRARLLRDLGRYREGLAEASPVVERARSLGYRPLEAEALYLEGDLEHLLDRDGPAERSLRAAVWAAESSRHDDLKAQAWVRLVWVVGQNARRLDDIEPLVQHAEAAIARLGRPPGDLEGRLLNARGSVLLVNGKPAAAIGLLESGLALRSRLHGEHHPDVALSAHNLAVALGQAGRLEESLAVHRRALKIRQGLLGERHPDLAWSLTGVGTTLRKLGRHTEALQYHRRALTVAQEAGQTGTPVAAIQSHMAEALLRQGDAAATLPLIQAAVQSLEQQHGREHAVLGGPLTLLGETLLGLARPGEAAVALERALAIREKALVSEEERVQTRTLLARARARAASEP